jgi:hypothetical protein
MCVPKDVLKRSFLSSVSAVGLKRGLRFSLLGKLRKSLGESVTSVVFSEDLLGGSFWADRFSLAFSLALILSLRALRC